MPRHERFFFLGAALLCAILHAVFFRVGRPIRASQAGMTTLEEMAYHVCLRYRRHTDRREEPVHTMLDDYRRKNGALYEQLLKDVRQGIKARQEVDMDMD